MGLQELFREELLRRQPLLSASLRPTGAPLLLHTHPAATEANAPVRVWIDGDAEITVGIGEYFHTHFDDSSLPASSQPKSPSQIAVEAASFVDAYLRDRIIVWVDHANQRGGSAGAFPSDSPDSSLPATAQQFTWSGPAQTEPESSGRIGRDA